MCTWYTLYVMGDHHIRVDSSVLIPNVLAFQQNGEQKGNSSLNPRKRKAEADLNEDSQDEALEFADQDESDFSDSEFLDQSVQGFPDFETFIAYYSKKFPQGRSSQSAKVVPAPPEDKKDFPPPNKS